MSRWAQAKQILELDWRTAWQEIAQGTLGELDAETLREARGLLDQLDAAYQRRDKAGFLAVKHQLVKSRSWTGSRPTSNDNPDAGSAKPTDRATQQAFPI